MSSSPWSSTLYLPQHSAYDRFDKTISQPFIVALMTDLLGLKATDEVLEIGTGLGYQAAMMASSRAKCQRGDH